MKINHFLIGLFLTMSSCVAPKYLPKPDQIDINNHGSYIKLYGKSGVIVGGEFIAIDSNEIVVLYNDTCKSVPLTDIVRFKLRYAKSKPYGWAMPAGVVLPFIHGLFSMFTLPLHLVVTISVSASGERAYRYNNKNMNYDDLKMFARFPQGIPSTIKKEDIK